MNKIIKLNKDYPIIKGELALRVKAGKFLEVTNHPKDLNTIGSILLRTTSTANPFVSLETGSLWGDSLENYEFKELYYNTVNLDYE